MGLGAVPAHAVYFSVYELYKQSFGGNGPGHHAAAGVVETTASDAGLTPMDVVKQRLQLRWRPYGGVKDCAVRMFREEGIRAFYASCKTTVVMNAPFTAVHFSTYEAMKKVLGEVSQENASDEMVMVHLTVASAVTTPLDVMKTRLQCQGGGGADKFSNGSIHIALRKIVAKEGPQALLQGLKPRVLLHAPAAAICWSTYEVMKNFLHHFQE